MRAKVFLINNTFQYLLFIITIGFLTGCSKGNEPEDKSSSFGIYLLEDQSITWEDLKTRNLDSLKLKDWITDDKIDFYDYSTHVIYLNVDYNTLFSVPHNDNTPFVVVANEKRCYYGRFSPPQDTTQPHVVIKPLELCNDLVMLEFNPPHRKDIRVKDTIKIALEKLGKLKNGMNIYLNRVPNIDYINSTRLRIEFSASAINLDDKVLLIPQCKGDMIKVGSRIYYSRVILYNNYNFFAFKGHWDGCNADTLDLSSPLIKYQLTSIPTKLHIGSSSFHDFPLENLPNGNYYCYHELYGLMGGSKSLRQTVTDGRIWVGYSRSNTINFDYDSSKGVTLVNKNIILE